MTGVSQCNAYSFKSMQPSVRAVAVVQSYPERMVVSTLISSLKTVILLPCFELLGENFLQYSKPYKVFGEWVVLLSKDALVTKVILH